MKYLVAGLKHDGTHAETRFGLSAKWTSPFKSAGGGQFSRLLAAEKCRSAGSDCIIFSKYNDHNLRMLLQGGKKQVKGSGEREIVYSVYKFMKSESEAGITSPLSKVQKRVAEATCVSRRTSGGERGFIPSALLTLILRRSRTGTVWFYTSTSNKTAARPKLYTKSLTRDLKLMYSRLTLVRISIKL